ncbi:hypothetical protein [Nocardia exalbida]|uniref:hypothetical protein n=1 Tax=Nocardia exalbida TaxID=290231 RepID=UPI0003177276|nr:hypothetical protein [Nocardia exalbida]
MSKPDDKSGLGFDTWGATAALLAILIAGITYSHTRKTSTTTTPQPVTAADTR